MHPYEQMSLGRDTLGGSAAGAKLTGASIARIAVDPSVLLYLVGIAER
jgi:hypothetical protein